MLIQDRINQTNLTVIMRGQKLCRTQGGGSQIAIYSTYPNMMRTHFGPELLSIPTIAHLLIKVMGINKCLQRFENSMILSRESCGLCCLVLIFLN